MSTAIAVPGLGGGGAVSRYEDDVFNGLTIQGGFLPRLGLYSGRSKIVERGLFPANHWGVVIGKDKLTDLGANVVCVPLAYRPMALDLREAKAVAYFDPNSAKFKECQAESLVKDSKCMAGVQILLHVKDQGFVTYYCASKSAKMLAPHIRKLTNSYISLGSQTVEAGPYVWRAPTVVVSNVSYDLPLEEVEKQKSDFINVGPTVAMEKDQEGDPEVTAGAPAADENARPR